MMSKKATVVLFVFIGASCTQAWQKDIWTEYGLQHQDQNSAEPLNLLGSITIQEGNVYITDPNSRNVYGSIVRQAEIVHSSPDDHEPSSVQSRTIIVPGGPDSRVIYYDYRKPSNANGGAIQSQQTNGRPELQYSTQQSYQDRQLYSAEAQGSQRRSTLPSNGVNGRNIPQPTNNYPYPYDRQAFYYSPSHQGHGPAAQQPNSYSSGQAYDRQKYLPSDRSNEPTVQQPPVPKANNNQGGASSLSNLGYGKANQHPQGYSSVPQAYNYGSQAHEPSTAGYGSYQPESKHGKMEIMHKRIKKQTPENESGTVLEALTIQSGNTYNTDPNSKNIYGSIIHQINQLCSSANDREPSKVETRTVIAAGGPEQGVFYASLGGSQNQLPVSGTRTVLGSVTIQKGNTYNIDPHSKNIVFGSITNQMNQVYSSSADVHGRLGSVTIQEGNTYTTHSNSSGSRPAKTTFNSLALSDKNVAPNKQPNLASNKIYSNFLCYFILLFVHYQMC